MFGIKLPIATASSSGGSTAKGRRCLSAVSVGAAWLLALAGLAGFAGCSDDSTSSDVPAAYGAGSTYAPDISAAALVAGPGNTYFPLVAGASWRYEAETEDGTEVIKVDVTHARRDVMGVSAMVVRDKVYLEGVLIEDTSDWYAQDAAGNVWYLGEDTTEYEDGEAVCNCGSWEWGVDGALPGVVMLANPQVGNFYRQEYYEGEAEDLGEVVSIDETVEVEAGTFTGCVKTHDTSSLDENIDEYKYYCPGVGVTLEEEAEERVELIEYTES